MIFSQLAGKYLVRIKNYPPFPGIEGKIIYITRVDEDKDVVYAVFTKDGAPVGGELRLLLATFMNDEDWYDATVLVSKAYGLILPKYDSCKYINEVAASYADYLDKDIKPISLSQAVGKICLIGQIVKKNIKFSKQGFYIVDYDDNGYILSYEGFCKPLDYLDDPNIGQRILNLNGSNRMFFKASDIVTSCNELYSEDCENARRMIDSLRVSAKVNSVSDFSGISRLDMFE